MSSPDGIAAAGAGRVESGDSPVLWHESVGGDAADSGAGVGRGLAAAKEPIEQLLGLGLAATVATQLAPDIGGLAQRYVTTAIPFNLAIDDIRFTRDRSVCPVHFVRVRWVA